MIESKAETGSLVTGSVAAIFASACCVGPLILVSVGLGGAWVSYLTAPTPYRWVFIGIAVVALAFAWKRIYRPAAQCEAGEVCAVPRTRRAYKIAFSIVTTFVAITAAVPYGMALFLGG
ncbi:MAG: mercuric ion transporter MerT [Betaproteobacteria bacterium]|nr:mercuric ion transporter MerT [Betaproteobacteria bacterium]MDH3435903.1 mercuric ion transporter MerT [Betaproteobacteria bacterium]